METIALPLVDLGGVWHITIFIGMVATVLYAADFKVEENVPLSAKLLMVYVALHALFILEFPVLHFGPYTVNYQATAGQVFAEILLIPLGAYLARRVFLKALPYLALFSCACVWMNWPGLLKAPSLNSAFAACAIPLIPWWARIAVLGTVVTHHGTTAILIVAAQMLSYTLREPKFRLGYAAVLLPLLIYSAYTHSGALFDGGERLAKYKEVMWFWAKEPRWTLIGVGPGSFMWTSMMLDHFKGPLFLQLHSDWLQILWELGIVGLVLSVWTFSDAVKRAWGDKETLAALFGCAAFALTYHPLRYYPTALLTAYIFIRAFSCRANSSQARPSSSSR